MCIYASFKITFNVWLFPQIKFPEAEVLSEQCVYIFKTLSTYYPNFPETLDYFIAAIALNSLYYSFLLSNISWLPLAGGGGGNTKREVYLPRTAPLPLLLSLYIFLSFFIHRNKYVIFSLSTHSLACCAYFSSLCFLIFKNDWCSLDFPNQDMKAENSVFFLSNFISLFLAVMGLCCYAGFSLVEVSRSYSLVAMHGLLIAVASLVAECRL